MDVIKHHLLYTCDATADSVKLHPSECLTSESESVCDTCLYTLNYYYYKSLVFRSKTHVFTYEDSFLFKGNVFTFSVCKKYSGVK